jgi:hypothetical protein
VLNVPVPQVVLYQARVRALVSEGEAARMAQHVGVGGNLKPGGLAIATDQVP